MRKRVNVFAVAYNLVLKVFRNIPQIWGWKDGGVDRSADPEVMGVGGLEGWRGRVNYDDDLNKLDPTSSSQIPSHLTLRASNTAPSALRPM